MIFNLEVNHIILFIFYLSCYDMNKEKNQKGDKKFGFFICHDCNVVMCMNNDMLRSLFRYCFPYKLKMR